MGYKGRKTTVKPELEPDIAVDGPGILLEAQAESSEHAEVTVKSEPADVVGDTTVIVKTEETVVDELRVASPYFSR